MLSFFINTTYFHCRDFMWYCQSEIQLMIAKAVNGVDLDLHGLK